VSVRLCAALTMRSPARNSENSAPPVLHTTGTSLVTVHSSPPTVPVQNPLAVAQPRQTPRPDRVNKELAWLQGFNDPGSNEGDASGSRQLQADTPPTSHSTIWIARLSTISTTLRHPTGMRKDSDSKQRTSQRGTIHLWMDSTLI
jgi:hypothetical protein